MNPRIGIVIGSTRPNRFGEKPARWLHGIASQRADLAFELLDLREYPLPHFDEIKSPAAAPPGNQDALRWGEKLDGLDGLVLVTPEYNHGPSAVLKNALDYAYPQFARKPVAFVGYGSVGAARAIEQLRLVVATLEMVSMKTAVHILLPDFLAILQQGKSFDEFPHLARAATTMLDELSWWAHVLKDARAKLK